MKHMIIDIGSNSVKYDIYEISGNGFTRVYHDSRVMGFLGYLENGVLSEVGFCVLCDILKGFIKAAKNADCEYLSAFATASFRSCSHPHELIERVYKEIGLKIDLLSGEDEGNMSFLGLLHAHPEAVNGIMMDMGGGSTEVNVFQNKKSVFLRSLPFGALSMKNTHAKRNPEETDEVGLFAVRKELDCIYRHAYQTAMQFQLPTDAGKHGYLVGGSAQYIGRLCATRGDDGIVRLNKDKLTEVIESFSEMTPEKARYLIQNVPKRHLLIIPAATAFKAVFDYMGIEELTVSNGGIRDGYMYHLINHKQ